ncbi:MAG: TadE/TadG family type IV pilus assembly protein [Pedobacter sp.]|nr:TadE/TadG family type IV pilus assembly protein [Pedobacter sp.]
MQRKHSSQALAMSRQKGAAAIEFALVFVLAFTVFYAMVSYAFPLLMLQTFNSASAQAVRAAVKADPLEDDYEATVASLATAEADQQLSYLPPLIRSRINVTAGVEDGTRVVVRIEYPNYNTNPVIPVLTLPLVGQVPRVPAMLAAESSLTP